MVLSTSFLHALAAAVMIFPASCAPAGQSASVVAASTPPLASSNAELVTVTMTEYRFTPDHLDFRHGVRYRLRLQNPGAQLHEFTAPAFFKAIDLVNPEVLAAGGQEIVLQPGEAKEVHFVARQPGLYRLTCADHDWAGMVGDIAIE